MIQAGASLVQLYTAMVYQGSTILYIHIYIGVAFFFFFFFAFDILSFVYLLL